MDFDSNRRNPLKSVISVPKWACLFSLAVAWSPIFQYRAVGHAYGQVYRLCPTSSIKCTRTWTPRMLLQIHRLPFQAFVRRMAIHDCAQFEKPVGIECIWRLKWLPVIEISCCFRLTAQHIISGANRVWLVTRLHITVKKMLHMRNNQKCYYIHFDGARQNGTKVVTRKRYRRMRKQKAACRR